MNKELVLIRALTEVNETLDIDEYLSRILNITEENCSLLKEMSQQLKNQPELWKRASLLLRLYHNLLHSTGLNIEYAKSWLKTPNKSFDNQLPIELAVTEDGLTHLCNYLEGY